MRFDTEDTIAAISTAPAEALRGILRISGKKTMTLVGGIFQPDIPTDPSEREPRANNTPCSTWTRRYGRVRLAGEIGCPAQLYIFRSPHSYTGQDMAELHVPGSPTLLQMVLESLLADGARLAEPGEFTARAFLNGRMDLSEAEAVAEVISAKSDAQLRGAERLLTGALHQKCRQITSRLADILALLEANIDFTDQDIELASPPQLAEQINTVQDDLQSLLANSLCWEELCHLPRVLVAGPANAGKSCLTNALLGMDRSIVNSLAGTTRDVLTGPLQLSRGECLLMDSAGLGPVEDLLAHEAQQAARQAIATCDLLLWVIDGSDNRSPEQFEADIRYGLTLKRTDACIPVINKIDRGSNIPSRLQELKQRTRDRWEQGSKVSSEEPIAISALRGDHLDDLKQQIEHVLHGGAMESPGQIMALTIRQREALSAAIENLRRASGLVSQATAAEVAALELREALDHLGQITGAVVTEEVLGRIFSRFCIGK